MHTINLFPHPILFIETFQSSVGSVAVQHSIHHAALPIPTRLHLAFKYLPPPRIRVEHEPVSGHPKADPAAHGGAVRHPLVTDLVWGRNGFPEPDFRIERFDPVGPTVRGARTAASSYVDLAAENRCGGGGGSRHSHARATLPRVESAVESPDVGRGPAVYEAAEDVDSGPHDGEEGRFGYVNWGLWDPDEEEVVAVARVRVGSPVEGEPGGGPAGVGSEP
ncbi:hypothetical protein PanWU01x14_164730 [Parasponia andersonii]|uniref:Uncharacterized protein n=1 Tax=Parasponia andersonii TaxID=3476 RepID=A0A2P5CCJ0_PARAD|nr:hypothetical protein PanWU01x14_164730 [Parasponia andersonii]